MPLGTNHVTNVIDANFIPELWSDDIIAAYKQNFFMRELVTLMPQKGKKGDTIHIPMPQRGVANLKAAQTQVTLNANLAGVKDVLIDKHYEYSRLLEDITNVQELESAQSFYTDDAGYALAKRIDTDLFDVSEALQGGTAGLNTWLTAVIAGDGVTAYSGGNASAITSAGILEAIQLLDDVDVPSDNRALILPPVARKVILGLPEFTRHDFVGEAGSSNSLRNGMVGDIYGIPVFISTNCPVTTTNDRIGLLIHKSALALAEQMDIRSQQQYKLEYLGNLFTADTLYGVAELRDDAGVALAMPA